MRASTRRCGAVCEHLEGRRLLAATMLQNIGTTTLSSNPGNAVAIGSTIYFAAQDATHGKELWKTDGTAAGTQLVKDIFPGAGDSWPAMLTDVNGTLFFIARGPSGHSQLWKSDGTDAGTIALKTLPVDDGFPESPLVVNGKLFFDLESGFPRTHVLWVSDGTTDGTFALTPTTSSAAGALTGALGAAGGAVYFSADDGAGDLSIWKTDGTPGGISRVWDFQGLGVAKNYVPQLTGIGNTLFFDAPDLTLPSALWETDGTTSGTSVVSNFVAFPLQLTNVNGTLFFSAAIHQIWKSDGTAAGTVMVTDVDSGGGDFQPEHFTAVANELFFDLIGTNDVDTGQLWKTDGAFGGTRLVKTLPSPAFFNSFTPAGDKLYFSAGFTGQHQERLWSSDGTAAGTQLVTGIEAQPAGADFTFTAAADKLFFIADDTLHGFEPWITDGTPAGTHLVADINTIDVSSYPGNFVRSGGSVFFTTYDTDLWKTDGTPAGTSLVRGDINPAGQAYIQDPVDVNGTLFFSATDGTHGPELWKSDGTAAGTQLVKDLDPGTDGSAPHGLTNIGGTLYFEATVPGATSHTDLALYRSDGTDAGTVEVLDLGTNGGDFVQVDGKLLFDSLSGLYAPNDTDTGLVRLGPGALAVVSATSFDTFANELVSGGLLYYFSPSPQSNFPSSYLLYRSDGTAAATYAIAATAFKPYLPNGQMNLTLSGGKIYFAADVGDGAGTQLWKTDGTAAGTIRLTNINPGPIGLNPTNLIDVEGTLFFIANDGVHGQELWKSDGTTAGTAMIADVNPGSAGSVGAFTEMVAVGPSLVFTANDGVHGV